MAKAAVDPLFSPRGAARPEFEGQDVSETAGVAAFATFDKKNKGYLTHAEAKDAVTRFGAKPLSEKEAEEFIKSGDGQNTGRIYYKDFVKLLKREL